MEEKINKIIPVIRKLTPSPHASSEEIRIHEVNSYYYGLKPEILMENAGASVAEVVHERFPVDNFSNVLVICGTGNNGGDGFVCARHLTLKGYSVKVVLLGSPEKIRSREAKLNWNLLLMSETKVYTTTDLDLISQLLNSSDLVVDAIFGIGLKGDVKEPFRSIIELINSSGKPVVSIDLPSGLDADKGAPCGVSIKATLTVTFHKAKLGFKNTGSSKYVGDVIVSSIGIPKSVEFLTGIGDFKFSLKERDEFSKKGDNGRVLVIGGSDRYSGAPAISALASLACGVDICVVAAPKAISNVIRSFSPSLIVWSYKGDFLSEENVKQVLELAQSYEFDSIVVGPGLGTREETLSAIISLLDEIKDRRLVIDADALKALSSSEIKFKLDNVIMTPHLGELSRMLTAKIGNSVASRLEAAREASQKFNSTIFLKGPIDTIVSGDKVKFNVTGNALMTVGGTGDILSGMCATLMAWGNQAFKAACAASFVNGFIGDMLRDENLYSISPIDIISRIPETFKRLSLKQF